jgi:hypothetical protein
MERFINECLYVVCMKCGLKLGLVALALAAAGAIGCESRSPRNVQQTSNPSGGTEQERTDPEYLRGKLLDKYFKETALDAMLGDYKSRLEIKLPRIIAAGHDEAISKGKGDVWDAVPEGRGYRLAKSYEQILNDSYPLGETDAGLLVVGLQHLRAAERVLTPTYSDVRFFSELPYAAEDLTSYHHPHRFGQFSEQAGGLLESPGSGVRSGTIFVYGDFHNMPLADAFGEEDTSDVKLERLFPSAEELKRAGINRLVVGLEGVPAGMVVGSLPNPPYVNHSNLALCLDSLKKCGTELVLVGVESPR